MNRRGFMEGGFALGALSLGDNVGRATPIAPPVSARQYWVATVKRVAYPVLHALSERKLKVLMPVEAPHGNAAERRQFTYLEAIGRLLSGLAPWLENGGRDGAEGALRSQFADWARAAIQAGTDPKSPDFMNFNHGSQPVVDAAFLALGILRAPNELWRQLDRATQHNVIAAFQSTRVILPGYNNWLLFSATIEAALCSMGTRWDAMRIDYAVRALNSWYKGDGAYGDGPFFHWDYYDSFVIYPMLLAVLETVRRSSSAWDRYLPLTLKRARRYAEIQERWIGPDGAFPPIGRSLCYRFGAFHLLSDICLRGELPATLHPAQVRCGLTAVIRRMMTAPGTFDGNGWLQVGFCGHQPEMAESYISTGSCYLCAAAWLPLGLPATDPFWSEPDMDWTSRLAWSGKEVVADHALRGDVLPPDD